MSARFCGACGKLSEVFLSALLVIGVAVSARGEDAPEEERLLFQKARELMASRYWREADELLASYVGPEADRAAYLRAFSMVRSNRLNEAADLVQAFHRKWADSVYRRKADMLLADAFFSARDFQRTEALLRSEAEYILSKERKRRIASIYLNLAEAAAAPAATSDPGLAGPDHDKAVRLYSYLLNMDLPDETIDYAHYQRAKVALDAGRPHQAAQFFRDYLDRFDPFWRQDIKGELAGEAEKVEPGRYLPQARLGYVQAWLRTRGRLPDPGKEVSPSGQLPDDVSLALDTLIEYIARDRLEVEDKAAVIRDAFYLKPFVTGLTLAGPDPATARKAVSEAYSYMRAYPADIRSIEFARLVPEALLRAGLSEDALNAYSRLAKGEDLEAGGAQPDVEGLTPQDRLRRYQAQGVYRTGEVFFRMGRLDAAAEVWQGYLKEFPDGSDWTKAQSGIYRTLKIRGTRALEEGVFEDCRKIWKQVISERPLDGETPWLALSLALSYAAEADAAKEKEENAGELYRRALKELSRVAQRYPAMAPQAFFQRAGIYRHKLDDLEAAVNEYRRSSLFQARQALQELTEVHLATESPRVFRNDEAAFLKLQVRNVPSVKVKVYRIDLEKFFRKYHTTDNIRRLDLDLVSPDRTWKVEIPGYADYRDIEYELPVEVDGPGTFAVMVESSEYESSCLVIKSDIEFIAASSNEEVVVLVKNAVTEEPVSGAGVIVHGGDKEAHTLTLTTGDDGVGRGGFEETPPTQHLYYFASFEGNVAVSDGSRSGRRPAGLRPKGYIYSSRPVYLPGETANVRGIIRTVDKGSYDFEKGREYEVVLSAPDGRRMAETRAVLSEFGTFLSDFELPEATPLGRYTVSVTRKKSAEHYSGSFQVQIVQPRKVFVEVEPSAQAVVAGDGLDITIRAGYYTGLPLVERTVVLSLPDGRKVVLVTDQEGRAVHKVDTAAYQKQFQDAAIVEFSAVVPGEDVSGSAVVRFMPAAIKMRVAPRQEEYFTNQRVDVDISLLSPSDEPLAGHSVKVELYRPGEPLVSEMPLPQDVLNNAGALPRGEIQPRDVRILEKELKTGDGGGTVFSFVPVDTGVYRILVSASDDKGRELSEWTSLEVQEKPSPALSFGVSSATVRVGEEVRVSARHEDPGSLGLLLFTGDGLISYRVYRFSRGVVQFDFEVRHEHFPNFNLIGLATGQKRLNRAEQSFQVERSMQIELELPEGPYEPGSEVEAVVTVRDHNGRPLETELALSLVDKGLLALYPDLTADIVGFFEEGLKRTAEFIGASSITFKRIGVTQRIPQAVLAEQQRMADKAKREALRADFAAEARQALAGRSRGMVAAEAAKPQLARRKSALRGGGRAPAPSAPAEEPMITMAGSGAGEKERAAPAPAARKELPIGAFWLGRIITRGDGRATIKIQIPERTSRYRVRLRGVTRDTILGQLEREITVRRDIFIDLKIPGFLFEGDRVKPIASVHNVSDFKGAVELKLDVIAGEQKRSFPLKTDVDGRGVFEVVSDAYEVPPAENLTAVLSATADGKSVDRIVKEVKVRPWGVEERDGTLGEAEQDVAFSLNLPSGVRPETVTLQVTLFPGAEEALLEMALDGPTAGGEVPGIKSTACRVIALLSVAGHLGQGRVMEEQVERLKDQAAAAVASLIAAQNSDGSFPWIAGSYSGSDLSTTAWSAIALGMSVRQGVLSEPRSRDMALNWLSRHVSAGSTNEDALEGRFALAYLGKAEFTVLNRIYRQSERLDTAGRALLGLAFEAMGKPDYATNLAGTVAREVRAARGRLYEGKHRQTDPAYVRAVVLLLLSRMQGFASEQSMLAGQVKTDMTSLAASGAARWLGLAALSEGAGPVNLEQPRFTVDVEVNGNRMGGYRGVRNGEPATIEAGWKEIGRFPAQVTLRYQGRGRMAYRAVLKGFSAVIKGGPVFHWGLEDEHYYHSPALYKGRLLVESSMKVGRCAYNDHVQDGLHFTSRRHGHYPGEYVVVTRWIPGGMVLDRTSLPGNAIYSREAGGRLTMVFRNRPGDFRLRLLPFCPGEYHVLPAEMASADRPGDYERLASERRLEVLEPGVPDNTSYEWTWDEHRAHGVAYFNDGEYGEALEHLSHVSRQQRMHYRDVVRALLWIRCERQYYNAGEVVDLFEVLEQRYPDVNIPYSKMLVIGRAYHDSGEDEAACYIWRGTLASSFRDDIPVAAELEQAGEYLRGVEYLRDLYWEYPDLPAVRQMLYQLSQDVYAHKDQAAGLERPGGGGENGLLPEYVVSMAVDILRDFLAMFNDLPYADEAVFSLLNAYLELDAYEACLEKARRAVALYPESEYKERYRYITALAAFHLQRYEEAVEAAAAVTRSGTQDSKYATFILGQMYQALGRYEEALQAYRQVRTDFADAAFSIEFLERRRLELPEVVTVGLGEPVDAEVQYCNVEKVEILAYRVDLMRLFLKEKNLDRVAGVKLAGITPTFTFDRSLPAVSPGTTGKARVIFPIEEEGAYLVLAHSGDVFASGLALVSPLKMEVQEYQGMVRVTIRDTRSGKPASEVRVTASAGYDFASDETDLRGSASLSIGGGERVTVIARRGKDEYAFYRSEPRIERKQPSMPARQAVEYDSNIMQGNRMLQQKASHMLRSRFSRRSLEQQGVRADEARK